MQDDHININFTVKTPDEETFRRSLMQAFHKYKDAMMKADENIKRLEAEQRRNNKKLWLGLALTVAAAFMWGIVVMSERV